MKKLELYQCEICGIQYKSKSECQTCEKSHVKPVQIIGTRFVKQNGAYPVSITVKMEDGKNATYKR